MFKLVLQGYNKSKVIESETIEESRSAYTEALAETFTKILGGTMYNCHWQTWKLFRDNPIRPLIGHFPCKEPVLHVMTHDVFVQAVSSTNGYGIWHNNENGKDVLSFGRTGEKCFAAHLSRNFNDYVSWDVAYQMYIDFLRKVEYNVSW